ncbi:MAG: hypothetical protein ACREBH_00345 [Candidatus Micrarchaeaceae archaeon]
MEISKNNKDRNGHVIPDISSQKTTHETDEGKSRTSGMLRKGLESTRNGIENLYRSRVAKSIATAALAASLVAVPGIMLTGCGGGPTQQTTQQSKVISNGRLQLAAENTIGGTLDFPNTVVGSTSIVQVSLTNSGSTSITVSSCQITGTSFNATVDSCAGTIAAGLTEVFPLTFQPNQTGPNSGSFQVDSNASNPQLIEKLIGEGVKQHTVSLSWDPSITPGVSYDVYRSTQSGGPYILIAEGLTACDTTCTYKDSTVESGQTYYYVVNAENPNDIYSTYSNQTTVTIPTP